MTVKEIFDFLNEKFPVETACDFDNPGILVGDPNSEVSKAIVALDCTPDVIKTAKNSGCQLIITHHPIIFEPLKKVLADSLVYMLIKSGISVISMHTNLDVGIGGVNDALCDMLELKNVQKVEAGDGYLLNSGLLSPVLSADELALYIKKKLGGAVKYVGCDKKIEKVLVCSGSGGSYLQDAVRLGCEALITADVKHNVFLDAQRLNIALYDAGHFNTEDVITEPLKSLLEQNISTVEFTVCHISKIKSV